MTTIQKKWFHATTKETWKKVKQIGRLGGDSFKRKSEVFLAANLKQLLWFMTHEFPCNSDMQHFELILTVKYIPNNIDDRWQNHWELVVKKPIPIQNLKVLRYL